MMQGLGLKKSDVIVLPTYLLARVQIFRADLLINRRNLLSCDTFYV